MRLFPDWQYERSVPRMSHGHKERAAERTRQLIAVDDCRRGINDGRFAAEQQEYLGAITGSSAKCTIRVRLGWLKLQRNSDQQPDISERPADQFCVQYRHGRHAEPHQHDSGHSKGSGVFDGKDSRPLRIHLRIHPGNVVCGIIWTDRGARRWGWLFLCRLAWQNKD